MSTALSTFTKDKIPLVTALSNFNKVTVPPVLIAILIFELTDIVMVDVAIYYELDRQQWFET